MKKMNYPADYAVLSNEEMTYTTGGGAVDDAASLATTAATVVGAVVLASSYIWGIKQARTWLQQDGNKDGNAVVQAAIDGLVDQTKSIERAIAVLDLGKIELEGSDSLDNPNAVFQ